MQPYHVDSGIRQNPTGAAATTFHHTVRVEGAASMRLYFGDVQLEKKSFIRITSLLDNQIQELDRGALALWGNASAHFNGDTLVVELVADAKTRRNRLITMAVRSEAAGQRVMGLDWPCGICGPDDRIPSSEPWSCRLLPAGGSASVWNEESCLVSCGHAMLAEESMWVEFNVPPSNGDCSINAPPIEDQFPIVAFIFANEGWGNDWAVMAPGTNNLGQTIFDRYGEFRPIAGTAPSPGDPLALWGFGIDPPQCEESSTQQTSGGSVTSVSSLFLSHDVDATHGCSGAGLIRDGEIVGIATHCPCPNKATRVDHPEFVVARQILGGPLPHDGCADAIPATEGLIAFNTTNATTDGSPHVGDCQFDGQTYHDIWYEYLALCDGILTVTTCEELGGSATYDTDLVVYDGCSCDSLVLVGCNDDDGINPCGGSPGYHSTVQVSVVSGHCYKIRVGGYSEGDVGVGMLHISLEPALANNDCLNAVVITEGLFPFNTRCATTDGQAHDACQFDGQTYNDIWFWYLATSSGTLTVSTCEQLGGWADYDTDLAVYTGAGPCPPGDGPLLGCNDDDESNPCGGPPYDQSTVRVRVTGGDPFNPYRIRVGGYDEDSAGAGVLSVSLCPCDCALPPDGTVNVVDFLALLADWGGTGPCDCADGGDGTVNVVDFLAMLGAWGSCP
jgi:hypothetical protein